MCGFHSVCRIAWAAGLLALGILASPVPAAWAGSFEVSGTYAVTSHHANRFEGIVSGRAKPGGKFTGTFEDKVTGDENPAGTATLDFGGGDTLTYAFDLSWDDDFGGWIGIYVITGGTGKLAGARGSGLNWAIPDADPSTGKIGLLGTLSP